ncbi:MAG: hypothetical protein HeimC3_15610 [Candidatus Heimdallarchaeota archaeon LC_3]|nr:MAG: hypothetical protein HeimC3_15610 [Candidatus Heimdallarchaeota archaeon LC_3]
MVFIMNKENFTFYLAGPIWNEPLNITKRDWRQFLTKKIESIGHVAIDPTKKKNEKFESETVSDVISYRKRYGFGSEKTSEFIDWIYFEDLRLIEKSDAIIAYLPKKITSFGTAQELFYNYHILKKKNFIITDMDLIKDTSVFLQKTTTKFFNSLDDIVENFDDLISLLKVYY